MRTLGLDKVMLVDDRSVINSEKKYIKLILFVSQFWLNIYALL